jgi:hypothetical protein
MTTHSPSHCFALGVRTLEIPYSENSAIAHYSHSHYRGLVLLSLVGIFEAFFSWERHA